MRERNDGGENSTGRVGVRWSRGNGACWKNGLGDFALGKGPCVHRAGEPFGAGNCLGSGRDGDGLGGSRFGNGNGGFIRH